MPRLGPVAPRRALPNGLDLRGEREGSVCGWRWRKRSAEAAGGPREECYVPRRAGREYVPGV